MAGELYVANDSGVVEVDGVPYPIQRGVTRVRAEHPIYRMAPGLFDPLDDHIHYDVVEQATATPGEKRGPGRPKKAAAE